MEYISFRDNDLPVYTCRECLKERNVHSEIAHAHQDVELVSVLKGSMECQTGTSVFELQKGDICFINRKQLHALYPHDEDESSHRVLIIGTGLLTQNPMIYDKYIRGFLEDVSFSHVKFRGADSHAAEINKLISELELINKNKKPGYELETLSIIYKLIWHLYEAYMSGPSPEPIDNNAIIQQEMAEYIYSHYGEQLTLDDIAASGSVSRSQCSKLFKQYTRMSPINFLNHHRLEMSCDMLRSTAMSVADIAAECGFSDQSYFSRLFQREYALTPLEYRKGGSRNLS